MRLWLVHLTLSVLVRHQHICCILVLIPGEIQLSSCPIVEFLEILFFMVLLCVGNISTLLNHWLDLVITCNCSHTEGSALLRKFSLRFLFVQSKSVITVDFKVTLSDVSNACLLLACHVIGYESLWILCYMVFTQAIGVRSRLYAS